MWRFAREMEMKVPGREVDGDSDDEYAHVSLPAGLMGVARGQEGCLQSCREISKAENELEDHPIISETEKANPDFLRLRIARSIHAPAAYLEEKDPLIRPEHVPLVRNLVSRNSLLVAIFAFFQFAPQ